MPREGDRIRVLSLDRKGTVFYVDSINLLRDYFNPIQVELDKPTDKHGQRMYRTGVKDIKILKKKAVEDVENITSVDQLEVGKTYMLFVKKKTHIEPTTAKIIKISEEGIRCYLKHQDTTKKKILSPETFLKQYKRMYDNMKNAEVTVRKRVKKVEEEEMDWSL